MENNEFCMKTCMWYYFDDIIKMEDFNFDIILIDIKNCTKLFWFTTLHIKLKLAQNHCVW